ncbi:tail fiber protein [Pelomonas aquatica]|jgi:phage-related tail fiber protein|uniref:Phage tail collar domain-containing protein n=1 Tax=Pelomonas aquatica TaxID=431058 RepID=A0A9X4LI81_9BURK|nr:tail fiber protein [Pelomonas aquatica]MCY4753244.1 tail fiber protein [Pelomonas aquatica]MDG0861325.1 hypothetical protein [Pelomonas aquatica]
MHRIDGPAAAPGGHFTDGDPNTGVPATIVSQAWAEAVQEELAGVIEATGAALAKPNNTQLLAAIKYFTDAAFPPGFIAYDAGSVAPPGWSLADGGELDRVAYARLFARIGTTYGAGNGTTTFNKPEIRSEFIRALDAGRGIDAGRLVGSAQAGQVQRHKHMVPWGEWAPSSLGAGPFGNSNTGGKKGSGNTDSDDYWYHSNDGSDYDGVINPAGVVGNETRPRNVAFYALIKL